MKPLQNINTLAEYKEYSDKNPFTILYFTGENCSVCHSMKPKIADLIANKFPKAQLLLVNIETAPEITGHFSVFTLPVVLMIVDGKEYMREARSFSVSEVEHKIEKIYNLYF